MQQVSFTAGGNIFNRKARPLLRPFSPSSTRLGFFFYTNSVQNCSEICRSRRFPSLLPVIPYYWTRFERSHFNSQEGSSRLLTQLTVRHPNLDAGFFVPNDNRPSESFRVFPRCCDARKESLQSDPSVFSGFSPGRRKGVLEKA